VSKSVSILAFLISLSSIALLLSLDPIAQDSRYHQFADTRHALSVPNGFNVLSNIPFLLAGLFGLWGLLVSKTIKVYAGLKPGFIVFFAGISLVSVGSSYYHLSPNNETLVWDRLPMTIAFMALFAITIGEFVSSRHFKSVLFSFLFAGFLSVIYWRTTESGGAGDLRPYALVQFLPMLLIPVFLIAGGEKSKSTSGYWALMACYVFAKIFEYYDVQIFILLAEVSGHSLKHVIAATGVFLFALSYRRKNQHREQHGGCTYRR
jgi:hypothetical protein